MICYKDMTFCKSSCTNIDCFRLLTEQVFLDANEFGLPVAQSDFSDTCEAYMPPKEN